MTNHTRLLDEARDRWEVDAFEPADPSARALLDRIVTTPAARPRPRRARAARRVAAALALATAAVTVALVAFPGASPDVIARAAAALRPSSDEAIVYRGELRFGSGADRSDGKVVEIRGSERWPTGSFSMRAPDMEGMDLQERSYLGHRAPVTHVSLGGLRGLLERARDGDGSVTLVGEATVRDRAVYELRMDLGAEGSRTLYVDRESYEPVRFEHDGPGDGWATLDFLKFERMSAEAAGYGASPDNIARAANALQMWSDEAIVYRGELRYGSGADRSDAKVIDIEGRESEQAGGFSTSDPGFRAPLSHAPLRELRGLLERARRDGDGSVTLVGEATVRDRAVYELRMDLGAEGSRTLYVDRESYYPVRVEHDGPGDDWATLDFLKVERMSAEAAGFGAPGPDGPAGQGGRP